MLIGIFYLRKDDVDDGRTAIEITGEDFRRQRRFLLSLEGLGAAAGGGSADGQLRMSDMQAEGQVSQGGHCASCQASEGQTRPCVIYLGWRGAAACQCMQAVPWGLASGTDGAIPIRKDCEANHRGEVGLIWKIWYPPSKKTGFWHFGSVGLYLRQFRKIKNTRMRVW